MSTWFDANANKSFRDPAVYGTAAIQPNGIANKIELQMQPRPTTPYGNVAWELQDPTAPSTADKFTIARLDTPAVKTDVLQIVQDPKGVKGKVFKITLDRKALYQAAAEKSKYRAHLGFKHKMGTTLKWGDEFWTGFSVLLAPEYLKTSTKDAFLFQQAFGALDNESGSPADSDNPNFAIQFAGGGATGAASARIIVRHQTSPNHLDYYASRTDGIASTLDTVNVKDVSVPGWPGNEWVTFVVKGRFGYRDDPQNTPLEYKSELSSTAAPYLKVWCRMGPTAPLTLVLDHKGRWGCNDAMPPIFNCGMYYFGAPPLWSGPAPVGGANAVRTIHMSRFVGYRAVDVPTMTARQLSLQV